MSDPDRLLTNKWTILDRATTLRDLARSFSEKAYEDFDTELFAKIADFIGECIKRELIPEVAKREGRPHPDPDYWERRQALKERRDIGDE